ncbi:hypothetical protein [Spirosoma sp.]|uniref:hypothetical protein n=1 Tax=Spirosoma sp. TaxID=1899569 RepID=UPI003B3A0894
MTYFIITAVILLLGVLSYFSSAWFGYRSSHTDPLPPHYGHLRRRLKKEKQQRNDTYDAMTEETEWLNKHR